MPQTGWLGPALSALASQSRFAISLDPENSIFVNTTNPLILAYPSPDALLAACQMAVQGDATKGFNQAVVANPVVNVTLAAATGTKVFGLRIRITDSVLNFKFGTYQINFTDATSTTPVVRATFNVVARKLPVDVICLSVSNSAGLATVVPSTDAGIQVLAASNAALTPGQDALYVETLNQRDLGYINNMMPQFTTGVPSYTPMPGVPGYLGAPALPPKPLDTYDMEDEFEDTY
jgi:hypothetical protein